MPSATNLSINDATPTAHVFVPAGNNGSVQIYRNTADAAIAASEETLAISLSRFTSNRPTDKVKLTLGVPHEQTVDGQVEVRDTARFTGEWTLPNTMSATERADFAALVANAIDNSDIAGHVEDLIPVW